MLQDISKAFNSIELAFLYAALKRIHIPPNIIFSILSIAENRQTNTIIKYSLAETSFLEKDIDQGDSISDVILTKVINIIPGFTMKQKFIHDLTNPQNEIQLSASIPTISYMDDTIWMADSQNQMEQILKIVYSFTSMTGLKINTDKSDLLVINPLYKNETITFGTSSISFSTKQNSIHYLEV